MASKIIKQGTSKALEIQEFLFLENLLGTQPTTEQVYWPELSVSPTQQQKNVESGGALKADVDIAGLEKNAFENGLRQGEESGMAMAKQKMEELAKRHAESILELGRLKTDLYAQVESEVARLAIEVAKKIVHREIQVDREIIQTLVHVALRHVTEKNPVVVHVNPDDYDYISKRQGDLSQAESRNLSILSDKSIERGGCLVETDCGNIAAQLEEKFNEVERAFFEGGS